MLQYGFIKGMEFCGVIMQNLRDSTNEKDQIEFENMKGAIREMFKDYGLKGDIV